MSHAIEYEREMTPETLGYAAWLYDFCELDEECGRGHEHEGACGTALTGSARKGADFNGPWRNGGFEPSDEEVDLYLAVRRQLEGLEAVALNIDCPACGQNPGWLCATFSNGFTELRLHPSRLAAAKSWLTRLGSSIVAS